MYFEYNLLLSILQNWKQQKWNDVYSLIIYLPFNYWSFFLILLLFKTLYSLDWCFYLLISSLLLNLSFDLGEAVLVNFFNFKDFHYNFLFRLSHNLTALNALIFWFFFFFFLTAPVSQRTSQVRDQTHATAMTSATAVTMWILNPLGYQGIPIFRFLIFFYFGRHHSIWNSQARD